MKVLTVLGARPQFIKAAMVSRAFSEINEITEVIVHTDQHFESNMSEIFFEELGIPIPQYHLGINNLSHTSMTAKMMQGLEEVMIKNKPDIVLVYGDTNSTLAASLTASKLNIPLAHVEAGLRSSNRRMPEEINRVITDRLSTVLYCPTSMSLNNLKNEGFGAGDHRIVLSGDVMFDASVYYSTDHLTKVAIDQRLPKDYILCTLHREENVDSEEKLSNIFSAMNEINGQIPVIMPLHPRTKKNLSKFGIRTNFNIIEPQGYLTMLQLIRGATMIMTDSGGLQKEAYFFNKPCVTIREETEWMELIDAKANVLSGTVKEDIIGSFEFMLQNKASYSEKIFGDAKAASAIAADLTLWYHEQFNPD